MTFFDYTADSIVTYLLKQNQSPDYWAAMSRSDLQLVFLGTHLEIVADKHTTYHVALMGVVRTRLVQLPKAKGAHA